MILCIFLTSNYVVFLFQICKNCRLSSSKTLKMNLLLFSHLRKHLFYYFLPVYWVICTFNWILYTLFLYLYFFILLFLYLYYILYLYFFMDVPMYLYNCKFLEESRMLSSNTDNFCEVHRLHIDLLQNYDKFLTIYLS